MKFFQAKFMLRLLAVLQLMSAVGFIQGLIVAVQQVSNAPLGGLPQGQIVFGLGIATIVILLNIAAGWTLLDESKTGLILSLVNTAAQAVSLNMSFFSYTYAGILRWFISLDANPATGLNLGTGFRILGNDFQLWFAALPDRPAIAISPVALFFAIYLVRRFRKE